MTKKQAIGQKAWAGFRGRPSKGVEQFPTVPPELAFVGLTEVFTGFLPESLDQMEVAPLDREERYA